MSGALQFSTSITCLFDGMEAQELLMQCFQRAAEQKHQEVTGGFLPLHSLAGKEWLFQEYCLEPW